MFHVQVWKKGVLWLPLFLLFGASNIFALEISKTEAMHIGKLIFHNECASKIACLTSWNKGEDFASLGIGHFIWYPEGVRKAEKRFDESFPKLLELMQKEDVKIPLWLQKQHGNPWKNREQFKKSKNTNKMREFHDFLLQTTAFQVKFMQNRLKNALPSILTHLPASQHAHIQEQFQHVANSPMGFYALMDYVNFKGEGIKISERYQGKGWGLLQVLEHMQSTQAGFTAIQDFSASAAYILEQRVALSPPSRGEKRWLAGWKKRLQTYTEEYKKYSLKNI
ncbi:MAG: hypothetical protein Q9M21_05225 [Mariprofundaceae bacterium]|nr:hypothetical protein [Mariprofundaceae bacterium]